MDKVELSKKAQQVGNKACKKNVYAQIGMPYYVVFDPLEQIQGKNDMNEALLLVWTISPVGYTELTPPQGIAAVGQSVWLEGVGLGLNLGKGQFEEEVTRLWLRWCDRNGQSIPTGADSHNRPIAIPLLNVGSPVNIHIPLQGVV